MLYCSRIFLLMITASWRYYTYYYFLPYVGLLIPQGTRLRQLRQGHQGAQTQQGSLRHETNQTQCPQRSRKGQCSQRSKTPRLHRCAQRHLLQNCLLPRNRQHPLHPHGVRRRRRSRSNLITIQGLIRKKKEKAEKVS